MKAFVSFTTNNHYCKLTEIMIESVHLFSKYKIILYCINFDKPIYYNKYPNLICKTIEKSSDVNIYYMKPKIICDAIINMNVTNGIYIEADDILNYNIDHLFNQCNNIKNYPLCPIHPRDPNNQQVIMNKLDVKYKSMPYVHAHIIFSYTCYEFINEWYKTCIDLGNIGLNWDETILNVLLWKYNNQDYITKSYDPYFTCVYDFDSYKEKYPEYANLQFEEIMMFHGCKNYNEAKKILNILKNIYINE
tara:strand:+ start:145 stop:888 length:744 start_codon:yes stop_codon:yes gene_type:complete